MSRPVQSWPDSRSFWRHKRVTPALHQNAVRCKCRDRWCWPLCVGSFVVDKLREQGAADITFALLSAGFVPRQRDYDPSTLLTQSRGLY